MSGDRIVLEKIRAHLPFALLAGLFIILLLAGGASRGDVLGQVVVRAVTWGVLAIAVLTGPRPALAPYRPVALLLLATIALPALQLVPLPPELWRMLPGRALFADAATLAGQPQPWRPLTLVPDGTVNALAALVVPFAVLVLIAMLSDKERGWLPGLVLAGVTASMLIGLLEFSGVTFGNALINDTMWHVSSTFANRNHFALFLAMGCIAAPAWAFADGGRVPAWRPLAALALIVLFGLTILATGSRAGMLAGAIAIVAAALIGRPFARRVVGRAPRWAVPAIVIGLGTAVASAVLLSIVSGRAASIERALTMDVAQDMRVRAMPVMTQMAETYFPFGAGFGSFDPIFRMAEPYALLQRTYMNHAHNDLLEVVIEGGLAALLLLVAGIVWVAVASARAWRAGPANVLPRAGSAMLMITLVASVFDYPARTPMILAMSLIAAVWLCTPLKSLDSSAPLPKRRRDL